MQTVHPSPFFDARKDEKWLYSTQFKSCTTRPAEVDDKVKKW
jgi:hypothetical protein